MDISVIFYVLLILVGLYGVIVGLFSLRVCRNKRNMNWKPATCSNNVTRDIKDRIRLDRIRWDRRVYDVTKR